MTNMNKTCLFLVVALFVATTIARANEETPPHTPLAVNHQWQGKSGLGACADFVMETDAVVGRVLEAIDASGAADRTLVLFTGDNGTDKKLKSKSRGRTVRGGKGRKLDVSTHVPLIAYWKGTVPAGRVCHDLIDFSDMMPTFVEMSEAAVPKALHFDGVSFLPQLRGKKGNPKPPKPYIFCYYEKGKYDPNGQDDATAQQAAAPEAQETAGQNLLARCARKGQPTLWVHDARWKLLDSGNFYDLENDPDEKSPIMKGEAGPVGERKRAIFERVLHEKSKIQKEYGPASLANIPSR